MYRLVLVLMFVVCSSSHAQKGKVLVWLSSDCPLSQKYTLVLRKLSEQHDKDSISFLAIFPSNSKKEIKAFIKKYHLTFAAQADKERKLTKQYEATITPEVVLLDHHGQIFYRGAIDNQATALGKFMPSATENYLQNAIEQLIVGHPCTLAKTTPIGCIIE